MSFTAWLRWSVLLAAVALLITRAVDLTAGVADYEIAQKPLYTGSAEPPLMLMVMSRDERLFTKAFSDYTDLNDDGVLDTTYLDTFTYEGYFDPKLCYAYNSGRFKAAAAAGGTNGHTCSGQWSGNFLNWVTMSRLDILRYVLYGGNRSTDTATQTVLERAHIPNDLHAWVKVYSGADIGNFTPLSGTQSFCNTSRSANGKPQMRVASGGYTEWAATALYQCLTAADTSNGETLRDVPATATNYTVQVEVCDPADGAVRESFCSRYGSNHKPVGLLQTYGEANRLRFGLISGSYSNPRSGGILRRNIGRFAGNSTSGCVAGDEVDLATGIFCNQASGNEGIINTISRFKLTNWNGWTSDGKWTDCNDWGILNRQGQGRPRSLNNPGTGADNCNAWGNPLAEMYAEALRYIAGEASATATFTAGSDLTGLPAPAWLDPYRAPNQGGNSYCASCNILVMSSGLPSFDSDEIPTIPQVGDASTATDALAGIEGISGNYVIGRVGTTAKGASLNTHEDICEARNLTSLSLARGICPDIPSLEGSYLMSGLAFKANTTDMRPGLQGKPGDHLNTVTTYAVALADNLPKFDIPVGSGKVTLAPLCQANGTGSAGLTSTGWRTCALGSVGIGTKSSGVSPNHVYGRNLQYDGERMVSGSFSLVWEDSLWGNDNDNDVVSMMSFCVGSTCGLDTNPNNGSYTGYDICWRSDSAVCGVDGRPSVGPDEVLVRVENLSAYAGNAMLTGFAITGSDNDGVHKLALRPGNSNGSVITTTANPRADWTAPQVMKFTTGASTARTLESPLWYAAKFGGFKDSRTAPNGQPDPGEWDAQDPGNPDNYFFARDPSKLKAELDRIFRAATIEENTTAGSGSGARIGDGSFTIEVGYRPGPEDNETDWVGYLRGVQVASAGAEGDELWNAGDKIPAPGARNIFVVTSPTQVDATGAVTTGVAAAEFAANNLGANNAQQLTALGVPSPLPGWLGATPTAANLVDYLRGQPVAGYRTRSQRLGDIINSQPEIVSPRDDYGYTAWTYSLSGSPTWRSALGTGYRDYLADKRANGQTTVFVGANDGMLHAFDATPDSSGGEELFAFIPAGSRSHLYELANPSYEHRYFVDGLIAISDVSFDSSGSGDWRAVLVGSTGAGGAGIASGSTERGHGSVFALDISEPDSFDADSVLWELTGEGDDDLGFVLGKPFIVPVKDADGAPRWVALFGNGPNSVSGLPVLYAVDIATGAVLAKLKPGTGYAGRNGVMNIAPVAIFNNDGLVDTVYGGDLQGNLWKFDLTSGDPSSWAVAYGGEPLFTAERDGLRQPITGGIEVSSGPGGGISIFFGTGSYFAEGDNASTAVQSLYGLWDNLGDDPISGRDALVGQTMQALAASQGYQTRGVGPTPPSAVNYAVNRGWYVDLVVGTDAIGERFFGTPRLQSGKVIFTTFEPSDIICSAGGGDNWLYVLDLLNGTGGMGGVTITPGGDAVCTGNCGAVSLNKEDDPSAPVKSTNVFVPKLEACDPTDPSCTVEDLIAAEQCSYVLRAAGADPLYMSRPCGRQSWRQVR